MEPMQVPPTMLIDGSKSISGHASGTSCDSRELLVDGRLPSVAFPAFCDKRLGAARPAICGLADP
jgi:hypothetical protein